MKKKLDNITLVIADTHNYGEAIASIKKSLNKIEPAKAKFLSDIQAYNPNLPFEIVKIPKIESKKDYSRFIIKELYKYFDTDFVLVTQHDGWVLDADAWDDEFLEYDYIGAPWLYPEGNNMGNGGFSLRLKKLCQALAVDDFIIPSNPEDDCICRMYRPYLEEKYGIKFAPEDLADKFSFELREPVVSTFGFHGKFHEPYKKTVIVKRSGALGDIIATEPLLEHYHKRGYNVAIDMPIHLSMFFGTHFFPIKHISQLDGRVVANAEIIDLDNAYEKNPKQLHLQSYYDAAGVTNGSISNPKLKFPIDQWNKLFKKYCVLHIDKRDQPYRNIYGVDWEYIVKELNKIGYLVIQVGQTEHEEVPGAIEIKTVTTHFLLYVVAGADLFIGVDSGISNMAVATKVPSVIFAGSVNPEYIYPELDKVEIIHNDGVCDTPYCWHDVISNTGQDCVVDVKSPPCTRFTNAQVLYAISKILGL